jgi:hypothetical protein
LPSRQDAANPEHQLFVDNAHFASEQLAEVLPEFWRRLRQDFGDNLTIISDSCLCSVDKKRYQE